MTVNSTSYKHLTNQFLLSINQDNMGNQAKMNTRASRGNLGVYNALVSNDNDAGVWMSYLFVNWDDKKQDNYIEVDPLADGVAQSDTDWCTY